MNRSTIPYSIVEERRRLNKCIESASNECEKEIYKKIRDIKIPYDKLEAILETSKELIKKKEKQRKVKKGLLFLKDVSSIAAGICIFNFICSKRRKTAIRISITDIRRLVKKLFNIFSYCGCCGIHMVFP